MITSLKDYTIYEKNINFFKENFSYSKLENRIIKTENLNYYFLRNFSTCIKPLYVFVDNLLHFSKEKYTKYDVVILTIYCLSVIQNEVKSQKILNILKIKELNHLIIPIKKSLKRLINLFNIQQKLPITNLNDIYNFNVMSEFIYFIEQNTNDIKSSKISVYEFLN